MPRLPSLAPSVPALVLTLAALASGGCGLALPSEALVERPDLRVVRLNVASANVFVVEQHGKRLMIDAGNPGDEREYEELMREHGIEPDSIDTLLLTHAHIDHAGTAAYFQRTYGVAVIGEHAFVGDMIRGSMVRNGVPTTHFFMCDLEQNGREMRTLLARAGVTAWHPAHFGPFGVESVRDYLDDHAR